MEDDNNVSPPDDHEYTVATSRDTTGGLQRPGMGAVQAGRKRPATTKPHSSPAGTANLEEEKSASSRAHDKIQRAKTSTIRSFNSAIPRRKRIYPEVHESVATGSTKQPVLPSSVRGEPSHSRTMRNEQNTPTTTPFRSKGKQRRSAGASDAEQTARESEEIEKLRRDLSESRSLIAELQKRLETQSRDPESSDSFLNTADKSSDSDVIRALQKLNAEVQQNTTYMAEDLTEDFEFENPTTNPMEERTFIFQRVSRRIGCVLVKSFRTNTPEDIPMLLQIAFQAYFASVLSQAVSSWTFDPAYNKFIREIYQRLRRVEAQAISGRWRSLTRAHNDRSWIVRPESLVEGILVDISDIVLAAGCTASRSDITSRLTSKFKEKISLLVELAGALGTMFDEIISSDFEAFIIMPGGKFKDKTMEDADDDKVGVLEGALVLCATHIGLRKWVPVGTLWEKGEKGKVVVLKAKVLLESFLHTEIEE